MGVNKVQSADGEIYMDISEDTVTEETLEEGVTAHNAQGEPIVGKLFGINIKLSSLKGTTWFVPSGWSATAGYGQFAIEAHIFVPGFYNQNISKINVGYAVNFDTGELVESVNNIVCLTASFNGTYPFTLTITDGADATNTALLSWLNTYGKLLSIDLAAYQTKTDEALETENKEIVGAINKLATLRAEDVGALPLSGGVMTGEIQIGQGDGKGIQLGTNGRINATVGTNTNATMFGVSNGTYYLGHSGFKTLMRGSATRPSYNNKDLALYEDISNLQPKTDESLVTESKEVIGAINELKGKIDAGGGSTDTIVGTWVFKDDLTFEDSHIKTHYVKFKAPLCDGVEPESIDLCYSEIYDAYYMEWHGDSTEDDVADVYWTDDGWLGVSYKTIEILEEPTDADFISWLKANAVKQEESGASNGLEMPQIRFANATYEDSPAKKWVDTDVPLTLTVEIVGGGALQVGDTLQICAKRTYHYKKYNENNDEAYPYQKQKLRSQQQRVITEEDLDKRFLTITTDDSIHNWLFKNDRKTSDNLSAFYMRIKRVTKYNPNTGQECDAIFSNVVTVWKTYDAVNQIVNIK